MVSNPGHIYTTSQSHPSTKSPNLFLAKNDKQPALWTSNVEILQNFAKFGPLGNTYCSQLFIFNFLLGRISLLVMISPAGA